MTNGKRKLMKTQTKLSVEIEKSKCLYKNEKIKGLLDFLTDYQNGSINKYEFILESQKKYSVLFEIQKMLSDRNIACVSIEPNGITFKLKYKDIQFSIDKSCRSALFELLNFGSYENDELEMFNKIINNNYVLLDIGSHLGWYSIHLAKQFKRAKIYAFEPVLSTYSLLEKNISMNQLENIYPFNFGFSDNQRLTRFFYSEIGSAVASERDIFQMQTLETVECNLKKLDDFVVEKELIAIDFIKLDVEGAEFLVIQGGQIAIKKFLPILFLEIVENWCNNFNYSSSELIDFLVCLGYKMFEIKSGFIQSADTICSDKIDNFNYLFLHQEKHQDIIKEHLTII